MDQVKEFLRQAVKYRFWILVGVSALMSMIAYFAASGSIKAETETKAAEIQSAHKGAQEYTSGTKPNKDYKPLVEDRTKSLTTDVDAAWRVLYERQAPLLTWPEEVADVFRQWGEKWPDKTDDAAINAAINNYVLVYPAYVEAVYKSFRPFNYEDGTGVVAAPSKDELLHPATYTVQSPPTYGKVWASQKKLWIQRTVLDVVNNVNAKAKDWDGAFIKQINALEVASPVAQDQRSYARSETLELAPEIANPNAPAAPTATTTPASGGEGGMKGMSDVTSKMASMGGMMGGMGGMSGSSNTASDEVYVFKPAAGAGSAQFDIIPVHLDVMIDQGRIGDLIAAFQNSPMTIQVLDFEMERPAQRIKKPAKGENQPAGLYGGAGGMMGMMGMRGMGGMSEMMPPGMNGPMGPMAKGMSGMGAYMKGAGRGMGYGGMGGAAEKPKGKDVSKENFEKLVKSKKSKGKEKEEEEAARKEQENRINDPYFYVVQVRVYGQARFYKAPPAPAPAAESQAPAGDAAAAQPAGDQPKADAAKAEGETKAEPAKADAKAETPKADAPKDEAPKAEAPKAEPPKDAPKPDTKGEATKGEPAKNEPPKTETPKDADVPPGEATKAAPKASR